MEKENIDRETLLGYVLEDLDVLCEYASNIKHYIQRDRFDLAADSLKYLHGTFVPTMHKCFKNATKNRRR